MHVYALGRAVVVTAGRTVLPRDVEDLEQRLRLLGRVEDVVMDVSGARGLDDAVVGRLAAAVRRVAARVEFRGLSLHQRRLLRYLGHPSPDRPPATSSGEVRRKPRGAGGDALRTA